MLEDTDTILSVFRGVRGVLLLLNRVLSIVIFVIQAKHCRP